MEPLKKLLSSIGGWPVFEDNWDESKFIGFDNTILAFRKYVNKYEDNIFNYKRGAKYKEDVREYILLKTRPHTELNCDIFFDRNFKV